MKKIYFVLFIIISSYSFGQDDGFRIQATSGIINNHTLGIKPFIGLQADYGFSDNFGLQTHLELGDGYFFSSANVITVPLTLALLGDGYHDNNGAAFLFLLTSFESMAFHIPVDDDFDVSIELSLLGAYIFEDELMVYDEDFDPDVYFGGRYGVALNFTPGDYFIASMHANIRKLYGMPINEGWGYGVNIGIGLRF